MTVGGWRGGYVQSQPKRFKIPDVAGLLGAMALVAEVGG